MRFTTNFPMTLVNNQLDVKSFYHTVYHCFGAFLGTGNILFHLFEILCVFSMKTCWLLTASEQ